MLKIQMIPLGPVQTNCYVLTCPDTQATAIIDPSDQGTGLARLVQQEGLELTHILLTHTHFDHVAGLADLKAAFPDVPVYMHEEATDMLKRAPQQAQMFGMVIDPPPPGDVMLEDEAEVRVGNVTLKALYSPGHAPGHLAFYVEEQNLVFSGDALFQGSIGRTDFPGCDLATLLNSIETKLMVLPDDTQVLSGHGAATTIGRERTTNPFLQ